MAKKLTMEWGGAEREFRLAIGQLRDLQSKCETGPATILSRLMAYQPQAATTKRPDPENYPLGEIDKQYIGDFNVFSITRHLGSDWRVDDVRETIRQGLIGGGATPTDANVAVMRYVDEASEWGQNVAAAAQILMHALLGEADDPVGKTEAETTATKATDA